MRASEAKDRQAILGLDDLVVGFGSGASAVEAVRGVSYAVRDGETLGVVGESGSGKSVTLLGAFGLLPAGGGIRGGRALFEGRDLGAMSAAERRAMLGKDVAFIFQNPMSALNPVHSVGEQIGEALLLHGGAPSAAAARTRAVALLEAVGIDQPERRLKQYPHEFSGGMCQRVMIAMALANRPRLLIADEPTTAVDATTQAQVLELLRRLRREINGGVVLVSHDLGVIAENADHIVVMYAGRVMESGPTAQVLARPQHPYTQGLLACRPERAGSRRLTPIPGQPPSVADVTPGCPFAPRCPIGRDEPRCARERPPLAASGASRAACWFAGRLAFGGAESAPEKPVVAPAEETLIDCRDIVVSFDVGRGLFGARRRMRAVDAVSVSAARGAALGVVGESGSGKSTLARVMMRLAEADSGAVRFEGRDVTRLGRTALKPFRDRVQMVFQDPHNSLGPHLSVGDNVAEPLRLRGVAGAERRRRVIERFGEVGLAEEHYDRRLDEMSGGQLQRAGIARALILDPDLLVMDEPVSALDASIQAQILNLLLDLRARRRLTYVFISHDMAVVRYLCDRVAVMRKGEVIEYGETEAVFAAPRHEYTRALLAAIPHAGGAATSQT